VAEAWGAGRVGEKHPAGSRVAGSLPTKRGKAMVENRHRPPTQAEAEEGRRKGGTKVGRKKVNQQGIAPGNRPPSQKTGDRQAGRGR